MTPRVVIVDDHGLFRAGVRGELGETIEVVGEAGSVAEAVPLILELDPDVVLLDVHLPDGGGQAVIAAVAPERPGVRFLALSVSDAPEDVIAVIRAGARGYVTKTISAGDLRDAVHRVAGGDAVFSPRLAGFVLDAFRSEELHPDAGLEQLTPREREVLRLIARGYRYKEIAASLHLSVKTVESHVSAVLRKLQLSSRHELTRWAAERRLISVRAMRALAVALAAAALAGGVARAAPAPSLVVQGDRVLAGVPILAERPAVEAKLGAPDSARREGPYGCVLRWRRLGLTMRLVDLSEGSPCRRGALVGATATGPRWRTAKGLRIGDATPRLRALYPVARLHAAAGPERGFWLVVRRTCVEVGGFPYPGLLARTSGGRVSALVVAAAICE